VAGRGADLRQLSRAQPHPHLITARSDHSRGIAKYYYYHGWWEGGAQPHLLVNLTKWNELPKIYQAMIQACAREAGVWMTTKYDVLNPQAVKRLVAAGAELRPFPQPVVEACYSAANEMYAELSRSNPPFKKMLDSLSAYRSDSYQWLQVAELAYLQRSPRRRASRPDVLRAGPGLREICK
jgi:TRAP-type mannitol/chloroaromatic compound transport system substrate-binding protein